MRCYEFVGQATNLRKIKRGGLQIQFKLYVYSLYILTGQLFHPGHLSRALCCRVNQFQEYLAEIRVDNYKLNHIKIDCTSKYPTPNYVQLVVLSKVFGMACERVSHNALFWNFQVYSVNDIV